jgi:hypothetical protein
VHGIPKVYFPLYLHSDFAHFCHPFDRVCRKEVYRTRLLCYRLLRRLHKPDEQVDGSTTKRLSTGDIETLIRLFDLILASEWIPVDHREKVVKEDKCLDIPACDFCGADIFQSFFRCSTCMIQEDDDAGAGESRSFYLCACCYAEGRSCICRNMEPRRRLRSYTALLATRNEAFQRRLISTSSSLPEVIDEKYVIFSYAALNVSLSDFCKISELFSEGNSYLRSRHGLTQDPQGKEGSTLLSGTEDGASLRDHRPFSGMPDLWESVPAPPTHIQRPPSVENPTQLR